MIYYRIYAPAWEQGLFTEKELLEKFGRWWKIMIKNFIYERIESSNWFKQFQNV